MTANDYDNYMAIGEQDNETHAEMKTREEKDVAEDAHTRDKVYSIFYGFEKREVILGRTREEWYEFCADELVSFETMVNLLCTGSESMTRIEVLQDVRQNSINAILRELGVE